MFHICRHCSSAAETTITPGQDAMRETDPRPVPVCSEHIERYI